MKEPPSTFQAQIKNNGFLFIRKPVQRSVRSGKVPVRQCRQREPELRRSCSHHQTTYSTAKPFPFRFRRYVIVENILLETLCNFVYVLYIRITIFCVCIVHQDHNILCMYCTSGSQYFGIPDPDPRCQIFTKNCKIKLSSHIPNLNGERKKNNLKSHLFFK